MIFEYTPDVVGTHESFWKFEIPGQKINHYFALIGTVVDPNVFFDVGMVNFGPLLINGSNKKVIKLKNIEHIPFAFAFNKESIKGLPDYGDSLTITPMSGTV